MFATPALPAKTSKVPKTTVANSKPVKKFVPLLNERQLNGVRGKQRCFEKLKSYPRASLPEIQGLIKSLERQYEETIAGKAFPKSKWNLQQLAQTKKIKVILEEVLIRVIVKGEDSRVVSKEVLEFHKEK
ncbi:hypothetical protein GCK72_005030 [Caenorhabditis remanei]|nr:hypothetical protein GCK72_005030 [Caenorhabditis remanei]KAF1765079.1 hypothetical protein GCK72_005030 [Caenorhabditis remanei]